MFYFQAYSHVPFSFIVPSLKKSLSCFIKSPPTCCNNPGALGAFPCEVLELQIRDRSEEEANQRTGYDPELVCWVNGIPASFKVHLPFLLPTGNKEKIMEITTVPQTVGSPSGFKDQPGVLFSVVAGLFAIFLVTALLFTLWFWNKRKKERVPYFRVTVVPLVTLSQSRERAKNIYGFLPQSQVRPGRRHSRTIRIFSTESLIPRNSENPNSEHTFSPTVHVLQSCRDSVPAVGYEVGIYDNTAISQVHRNLIPAVDYVNVGASIESMSTSSEDSQDYVNVPNAKEVSRNPGAMDSLCEDLHNPQTSEESEPSIERDSGTKNAEDSTSIWVLGLEDSDYNGDAEGSSLSSNDYVNVPGADNEEDQGRQHWVTFQDCRAYDNVLWAEPNRKKLHAGEVLTSTNRGGILGWTPSLPFGVQCEEPRENSLDSWDNENIEPLAQDGNSQDTSAEMDSEDSDDYINVPAVIEEGKLNTEHGTEARALTTEQKLTNQDGVFYTFFPTSTSVTT